MMRNKRPEILLIVRGILFDQGEKVLLVKRAAKDRWEPGKWELPGGKLDQKEDVITLLKKEIFEETGLKTKSITTISYLDSYIVSDGPYSGLTCVVLVGVVVAVDLKVKISQEHDDFTWVSLKDRLKYDITFDSRKALDQFLKSKQVKIK